MSSEPPIVPELHLDPDGRPLVVFDLQGDPRDVTVWGAVVAGPAVALVATDTDDPPTAGELMALADALNPERVDLLVEAREKAHQLAIDNQALRSMHDVQVHTIRDQRAEMAVLQEHVDGLRASIAAARTAGRDVARLAVIALLRNTKPRRPRRRFGSERTTP